MSSAPLGARALENALWNALGFVVGIIVSLVASPFVVKRVGVELFGVYGLTAALLAPLSLANLGFGEATVKYVAQHVAAGETGEAEKYIQTTLALNLAVGVVGGLLVAVAGPYTALSLFKIAPEHATIARDCLRLAALGWLLSQGTAIFTALPAALQRFDRGSIGASVLGILGSLLSMLFVWLGWGVVGYAGSLVVIGLLSLLYWVREARSLLPGVSFWPRFHRAAFRTSFSFGGWHALSMVMSLAANQAERFLLGALLPSSAVGVYNVALSLEQRVYQVVLRFCEVLFPMFAALGEESLDRKAALVTRATWITSLFGCALMAPLVPLADPLLALWMSRAIADEGSFALQALSVAGLLGSGANVLYFYALAEGKTRALLAVSVVTGVGTVVGASLLLPRLGLRGAGLGILASVVLQVVTLTRVVRALFPRGFSLLRQVVGFYGPSFISIVFVVALSASAPVNAALARLDRWPLLIAGYCTLCALVGLAVVGVTFVLPHGSEHITDVRMVLSRIASKLDRLR